ncbi:hypothetical protein JCM4914_71190 [Streptomyces platensis subsp. malvinus]
MPVQQAVPAFPFPAFPLPAFRAPASGRHALPHAPALPFPSAIPVRHFGPCFRFVFRPVFRCSFRSSERRSGGVRDPVPAVRADAVKDRLGVSDEGGKGVGRGWG